MGETPAELADAGFVGLDLLVPGDLPRPPAVDVHHDAPAAPTEVVRCQCGWAGTARVGKAPEALARHLIVVEAGWRGPWPTWGDQWAILYRRALTAVAGDRRRLDAVQAAAQLLGVR